MRALAEFIMAGRLKAALIAFGGSLLPFVSPAAVGLVALRQSLGDGFIVTLWAILPLALMRYVSDMSAPMIWASIATVPVVLLAARVLRVGLPWAQVLMVIVGLSGLAAVLAQLWWPAECEQLRLVLSKLFAQLQPAAATGEPALALTIPFVIGMVAVMIALSAVGSLLLARWWQALLFNPGGFRQEFHALRIDKSLAVPLLVGVLVCYSVAPDYMTWGTLLGVPLLLGGIAVAHHVMATTGMGVHWLVMFYVALVVLMGPVSMLLMGLGFCDSMLDLRARLAARQRRG